MNRFKTDIDGGLPLRLNDFRFIDESNKDALTGIIKSLIGEASGAKIFGCEVVDTEQGDVFTCSEGYVYFNGEIFYVPAHNLIHSNNFLYFTEDISYEASGNRIFKDTLVHDVHEVRHAKLESGASFPAGTLNYDADSAGNLLGEQIGLLSAWGGVVLSSLNVSITDGLQNITGYMTYKKLGKTMTCVVNLQCDVMPNQPADAAITIQLRIATAKTDQVVATSLIANSSAQGEPVMKMRAVGSNLEILNINESPILGGSGYAFKGELTFEIQ